MKILKECIKNDKKTRLVEENSLYLIFVSKNLNHKGVSNSQKVFKTKSKKEAEKYYDNLIN